MNNEKNPEDPNRPALSASDRLWNISEALCDEPFGLETAGLPDWSPEDLEAVNIIGGTKRLLPDHPAREVFLRLSKRGSLTLVNEAERVRDVLLRCARGESSFPSKEDIFLPNEEDIPSSIEDDELPSESASPAKVVPDRPRIPNDHS
jgi:hypothetical protein